MRNNKQKKQSVVNTIIIAVVVITVAAMTIYSKNSINLKLNFFGAELDIEKTETHN